MGLVSLPLGSGNSGTNDWSDVYNNDAALATGINNVEAANLASNAVTTAKITDANVTDAKLASPNNSTYKTLLTASASVGYDAASGAKTFLSNRIVYATGAIGAGKSEMDSGSNYTHPGTASGSFWTPLPLVYLDDADFTVGSLTTYLRLRAQVSTNATAWSSVTITFGLYPVTIAGGNNIITPTLGTVTSGSTVAHADPGASGTVSDTSGDFAFPSDGLYGLGYTLNAQLTDNAAALLTAQLQVRNVSA